jgi:hypothetical protein
MADEIVRHDVQVLIDGWMQLEREGVQFPVPLHEYWWIAGHRKKQDAIALAESLLGHRYGILTRNGKPDFKKLGAMLERLPQDAFTLSVRFQDNYELRRSYIPELDRIVANSERNRWIGE